MFNGSGSRLESLFVEYNDRLVGELARVLRGQWHLAEDLAQEAWIEVGIGLRWRSRDEAGFEWVLEVARRVVTRHFRIAENRVRDTVVCGRLVAGALAPVPSAEESALELDEGLSVPAVAVLIGGVSRAGKSGAAGAVGVAA